MRSASLQSPPATPVATPRRGRSAPAASLTLAAMSLGYGVVQLDVTIVNTALMRSGIPSAEAFPNCNGWSAPTRLHLRR